MANKKEEKKGKELLNNQKLRNDLINRLEVLDKVGTLLLIPNSSYATTEQVAKYYKVGEKAISSLVHDNREEIESDGYKVITRKDINDNENFEFPLRKFKSMRGKTVITFLNGTEFNVTNTGMSLFPKRAILRVGMLLQNSEIAKEVRTRLLDIIHDTEKTNPEIIKNIVNELDEEKQLMLKRIEAELAGDFDTVCIVNAKLFALKNKRIIELEKNIENITTNALTITESKAIINRIIRTIAATAPNYKKSFGKVWSDFYSKLNYQLGINIKARGKTKKSYLNSLTDDEILETEKIARSWALEIGLDLKELLSIA